MGAILGPDGERIAAGSDGGATPTLQSAPVALQPRTVGIKDGPITLRVKMEFEETSIGGDVGPFLKAMDAVLNSTSAFSVRIIQFMLLAAARGVPGGEIVAGALQDIKLMRVAFEGMLTRLSQGLDPIPQIEVAQVKPDDPPPR